MIQTIFKQVFGAAGSQSGALTNQDCNGLVIYQSVAFSATDFLTVLVKSPNHETKVLVNRIGMLALAELSDAEFGQSPSLQAELEVLSAADYLGHAAVIPLGCLKQRGNDSTLEILYECGQACTVSMSAFFNNEGEDHLVATIESRQSSDRADDVDSLWVFNPTATSTPHTLDLSIMIKSAYGSTVCNAMDAFGYTSATKRIEAWAPKRVACVFDGADRVHDSVSWVISGADAGNFRVIARSVMRDTARVSRGTIQTLGRMQQTLAKKSLAHQQALKRSGIIDVAEVFEASRIANVPKGN